MILVAVSETDLSESGTLPGSIPPLTGEKQRPLGAKSQLAGVNDHKDQGGDFYELPPPVGKLGMWE